MRPVNSRILSRSFEVIIVSLVSVLDLLAEPHRPEEGGFVEHLYLVWVAAGQFLRVSGGQSALTQSPQDEQSVLEDAPRRPYQEP